MRKTEKRSKKIEREGISKGEPETEKKYKQENRPTERETRRK